MRTSHYIAGVSLLAATTAALACSSSSDGYNVLPGNQATTAGVPATAVTSGGDGSSAGSTGATGATSTGGIIFTPEEPDDTLDPGEDCAQGSGTGTPAPAVLQLVVDNSLSMNSPPDGTMGGFGGGGTSKWVITRDALLDALDELGANIAVGLNYFPGEIPEGGCVQETTSVALDLLGDAGSAQRQALADSLNSTQPDGYTPTHSAVRVGVQTVQAYQSMDEKFVVLVTDGAPTEDIACYQNLDGVDTQPIIDESAAAAALGIRTVVIGSPGSESARDSLSAIARVGGTGSPGCADAGPQYCHFDMSTQADFAAALRQALADIVGQISSCEFAIPPPPAGTELDLGRVNVNIVDGSGMVVQEVLKAPDGSGCSDGWEYSADMTSVVLCESTCQAYSAMQSASVEVLFGCMTKEIPK